MSKYGDFSGLYFSAFSPNAGKYGPEKSPYLDTFHAVATMIKFQLSATIFPEVMAFANFFSKIEWVGQWRSFDCRDKILITFYISI